MNSSEDSQYRTLKAKKASTTPPQSLSNAGNFGPTTFFLRSEKEVEKSAQRGRKTSRGSMTTPEESAQKTPVASMISDSSFGVQSLEDTISTRSPSNDTLSRTDSNLSNASEASMEAGAENSVLASRKRKAGNRVHPSIVATGQRIISGELASGTGSPLSYRSAESPLRTHVRRNSTASSVNISQPLTPLKMSPKPESAMPSTPRSGSPKSFRLSDEEVSIASDTGSQAVQSSSGEEEEDVASDDHATVQETPQLVMPSITMPARRSFTERGKRMGRLKLMVVGDRGVGKTSLIQSICRACEDIVHLDPVCTEGEGKSTTRIIEIGASTRPCPSWWTDFETRRMLLKRKSVGDGVLERNVTFVDTPGLDREDKSAEVLRHFKASLSRTANMERMNDIELVSMLSGEGGVHIDAVLYLFNPATDPLESSEAERKELLQYLYKWTNVIPLIARADTLSSDEVTAQKQQVRELFSSIKAEMYPLSVKDVGDGLNQKADDIPEPFAISSAVGDDSETIDASILMSSTYLQPLLPSELNLLLDYLLEPDNIAKLRHIAATKFLLWRQENLGTHIDLEKLLKAPRFDTFTDAATSTNSLAEDPSKVLVPHANSSYYRSTSPAPSDSSALSGANITGTSAYALARYNDNKSPTEPFRQVRLAKWAQDLQRSLDNERKRFNKRLYPAQQGDWVSSAADSEKAASASSSDPNQALVSTSASHRPGKGRLGGEIGIIDPRDPLGVLAFSQTFRRQSWLALQVAGSCGLIGAVAWWVVRNWGEVQDFLGLGATGPVVTVTGVPAPTQRGGLFGTSDWKGIFSGQGMAE